MNNAPQILHAWRAKSLSGSLLALMFGDEFNRSLDCPSTSLSSLRLGCEVAPNG